MKNGELTYLEACVNFNYRLNPMVQEMKTRIKRGELGDVRIITGHKIVSVCGDLVTVLPTRKKPKNQKETFKDSDGGEHIETEVKNEDYAAVMFKADKGA